VALRSFFARSFGESPLTDSPRTLAALRIAVAATLLGSPELYQAEAALARALASAAPEGLGWLAAWLPTLKAHPGWLSLAEALARASGVTLLLGYWSRASSCVLTLSGGFLCALSSLGGAVLHDMHLFWFTLLLSLSRAGDAWSLDAWGKRIPAPGATYGVPLSFARGLLSAVYFFPGVHKLLVPGFAWLSPANIAGHMHGKWFQTGWVPALRIDDSPLLCAAGGAAVVLFELSAPVLFLVPRLRLLGFASTLAFHLATDFLLRIQFVGLMTCAVVLLPWDLLRGPEREPEREPGPALAWRPAAILGSLLAVAVVQAGARGQTQAWPFGCYPTFAHTLADTVPDVNLRLTYAHGERLVTGRATTARTQDEWRRVYFVMGAYPQKPSAGELERFARELYQSRAGLPDPSELERATLVRAEYSSAPEHWGKPPVRERPLSELRLGLFREVAPKSGSPGPRADR